MATIKQIAANRRNAQKSTGPRSSAGKTQAALNAPKHGFAGSSFTVVRLEDLKDIDNLRQDALDFYRPVNSQEIFAVERIALCQMALLRIARLESGILTTCLDRALYPDDEPIRLMTPELAGDGDIEITRAQNRNFALSVGFHKNTERPHTWELFLRYQTQTERQYRRAIEDFERLRAMRPEPEEPEEFEEMPNEPNSPQPESPQPDPAAVGQPIMAAAGFQPAPGGCEGSSLAQGVRVTEPGTDRSVHAAQKRRLGTDWSVPSSLRRLLHRAHHAQGVAA